MMAWNGMMADICIGAPASVIGKKHTAVAPILQEIEVFLKYQIKYL